MATQALLEHPVPRAPNPLRWAVPLIPVAVSVFVLSALLYYKVQAGGTGPGQNLMQRAIVGLYTGLGFVPSFMLCILLLSWGSIWFITGKIEQPVTRVLRIVTVAIALTLLVNLGQGANPDGGEIGRWLVPRLQSAVGFLMSTVLVIATTVAAMLLATDFFFYRYFEGLGRDIEEALPFEPGIESEATQLLAGTSTEFVLRDEQGAPAFADTAGGEIERRTEFVATSEPETAVEREAPRAERESWRRRTRVSLDEFGDEREEAPAPAREEIAADTEPALETPPAAEPEVLIPAPTRAERTRAPAEANAEGNAEPTAERDPERDPSPDDDRALVAPIDELSEEVVIVDLDGSAASASAVEPSVEIPRAEQGHLFGRAASDDALLDEAERLVLESRRANAAFLRNRLRVRYEDAVELLQGLASRGIVEIDESGTQARVLAD